MTRRPPSSRQRSRPANHHIDTAARYGNERGVGEGVCASGVPREELFIATKLDGPFQGEDRAVASLDDCLRLLLTETGVTPAVNQIQLNPAPPGTTAAPTTRSTAL